MSGTIRLVNSVITKENGSKSTLNVALDNANEFAKQQDKKDVKKQEKKDK